LFRSLLKKLVKKTFCSNNFFIAVYSYIVAISRSRNNTEKNIDEITFAEIAMMLKKNLYLLKVYPLLIGLVMVVLLLQVVLMGSLESGMLRQ
jgi:hypothetical protein